MVGVVIAFYPQLQAICFDEPYARTRGVPTGFFTILLVTLTAVTVVLMVSSVGIVMVIAMLTLPAATAGLLARRLWTMMLFGALFCAASNVTGAYGQLHPGYSRGSDYDSGKRFSICCGPCLPQHGEENTPDPKSQSFGLK